MKETVALSVLDKVVFVQLTKKSDNKDPEGARQENLLSAFLELERVMSEPFPQFLIDKGYDKWQPVSCLMSKILANHYGIDSDDLLAHWVKNGSKNLLQQILGDAHECRHR
jgi:hypothetical protein